GPHTVSELCEILDAPQSNVSQHLGVLRTAGLVVAQRQRNHVFYSLRHAKVVDVIDDLRSIMADELNRRSAISG
ncbi:MAG: helix-turn-helix domain-containing protein, partial [Acidimicrobiia bacterium]|nr:helix-turn-helix domain-containing protein [Acidimicrobiia bacterium]